MLLSSSAPSCWATHFLLYLFQTRDRLQLGIFCWLALLPPALPALPALCPAADPPPMPPPAEPPAEEPPEESPPEEPPAEEPPPLEAAKAGAIANGVAT